jgi:hypothetical protein
MDLVLPRREMALFALLGFGVWLSGAVMFRFGGHLMFESGPWVLILSGVGVAISVCLLMNATMAWRRAPAASALSVAVAMALPGLFADVFYVLAFAKITGLQPLTAAPFAAVLIFGNASLLAYALFRGRSAS